jgi:hypothetical protein
VTELLAYAIALGIPAFAFYLIRALDLFKTSKPRTILLCALWGALAAYPLAAVVNGILRGLGGETLVASLTAPLVEEALKALVLVYFTRQPSFCGARPLYHADARDGERRSRYRAGSPAAVAPGAGAAGRHRDRSRGSHRL